MSSGPRRRARINEIKPTGYFSVTPSRRWHYGLFALHRNPCSSSYAKIHELEGRQQAGRVVRDHFVGVVQPGQRRPVRALLLASPALAAGLPRGGRRPAGQVVGGGGIETSAWIHRRPCTRRALTQVGVWRWPRWGSGSCREPVASG